MGDSEEAMAGCEHPNQCPFEALIHEMGTNLREMARSLSQLALDVAALKATAAAGAPWKAGVMWLIGLVVAIAAIVGPHLKWK